MSKIIRDAGFGLNNPDVLSQTDNERPVDSPQSTPRHNQVASGDKIRAKGVNMADESSIRITKRAARSGPNTENRTDQTVDPHPTPIRLTRRKLVLTASDVQSLNVTRPRDGAAVHQLFCKVTGSAGPEVGVWLEVNAFQSKATCGPDGKFSFPDVPLNPGSNELRLGVSGFDEPKARLSVTVKDPFLHRKAKDPYTKELFKAGDVVVRCTDDKNYVYKSVWQELGHCPICKGRSYCESNDSAFFVPKGG